MLTGEDFDFHCHSNLVRAVAPYGLTEFDVHDVLNVFQRTGLARGDASRIAAFSRSLTAGTQIACLVGTWKPGRQAGLVGPPTRSAIGTASG